MVEIPGRPPGHLATAKFRRSLVHLGAAVSASQSWKYQGVHSMNDVAQH